MSLTTQLNRRFGSRTLLVECGAFTLTSLEAPRTCGQVSFVAARDRTEARVLVPERQRVLRFFLAIPSSAPASFRPPMSGLFSFGNHWLSSFFFAPNSDFVARFVHS